MLFKFRTWTTLNSWFEFRRESADSVFRLPRTIGIGWRNSLFFRKASVTMSAPPYLKKSYREVTISQSSNYITLLYCIYILFSLYHNIVLLILYHTISREYLRIPPSSYNDFFKIDVGIHKRWIYYLYKKQGIYSTIVSWSFFVHKFHTRSSEVALILLKSLS